MKRVAEQLRFVTQFGAYLGMCRQAGLEKRIGHVPPSKDEVESLIQYLRNYGASPVIVGSAAVIKHLDLPEGDLPTYFRPTKDLDIFCGSRKLPPPLDGWHADMESPGLVSWISPSGGYVDFLQPGHEFPGGAKSPAKIETDDLSKGTNYPVASLAATFKLKLNTMRQQDLLDLVAVARRSGVPDLGGLNQLQKENLELVKLWVQSKPKGTYGE